VARMLDLGSDGGIAAELETLRDRVVRQLEEKGYMKSRVGYADPFCENVPVSMLLDEVHRAAGMSVCPRFWQDAVDLLGHHDEGAWITLARLTGFLLSWLQEAVVWESSTSMGSWVPQSAIERDDIGGLPVSLHIYDVSQNEKIQKLNRILAHESSPLKLGGVFHAGVEVNGMEWSYGFSNSLTKPGVACTVPKAHPQHHFRETVACKRTRLNPQDISDIISTLIEEYPGYDYDLLRRNCCNFADDFLQRLGVGGLPGWVHRLARIGANVDTMVSTAQAMKQRIMRPPRTSGPPLYRPNNSRRSGESNGNKDWRTPDFDDDWSQDPDMPVGIWGRPRCLD